MDEKFLELLKKYENDSIIMLDAIYQWAMTPATDAAVKGGFLPDHSLIKTNLKLRYNLNELEAEEVFSTLGNEIESIGFEFSSGFIRIGRDNINNYFETNDILKKEVLRRLKSIPDEERYIVWLFCNVKSKGKTCGQMNEARKTSTPESTAMSDFPGSRHCLRQRSTFTGIFSRFFLC